MRFRPTALLGLALSALAATAGGAGGAIVIGNDAPAWSPDGQRIAFTAFRHGNGEIYVMDANGSSQLRLTRTEAHDDHAAWSPDGRRIAFASTRDGDYEIYVMNADGSDQRRLTDDPQSDFAPTWSPDGRRIAWRTNRDGGSEIYVMDADGSNPRRLTVSAGSDEAPDWSVDDRIAFASNRQGGNFNIYVMDADGSNVRRVTSGRTNRNEPDWSPDGSRLVYVSDRDLPLGNTEIYVVNADGSDDRRLTDYEGRDDWPTWSPDGSKILFTRGVTFRAPDIFVANPDGSGLTKLTTTAAQLEVTDVLTTEPRAGRLWAITLLVEDIRGLPLRGGIRICHATLGGKQLRLVSGRLTGGIVGCVWRIPASARGKTLRGTIGLRAAGLTAQQPFALRVR